MKDEAEGEVEKEEGGGGGGGKEGGGGGGGGVGMRRLYRKAIHTHVPVQNGKRSDASSIYIYCNKD